MSLGYTSFVQFFFINPIRICVRRLHFQLQMINAVKTHAINIRLKETRFVDFSGRKYCICQFVSQRTLISKIFAGRHAPRPPKKVVPLAFWMRAIAPILPIYYIPRPPLSQNPPSAPVCHTFLPILSFKLAVRVKHLKVMSFM